MRFDFSCIDLIMKKSENVSKTLQTFEQECATSPLADMLPFSGLGFDLHLVPAMSIRLATRGNADSSLGAPSMFETVFLSGRWLQVRLGREIRGR
jgi:hypothetical protein